MGQILLGRFAHGVDLGGARRGRGDAGGLVASNSHSRRCLSRKQRTPTPYVNSMKGDTAHKDLRDAVSCGSGLNDSGGVSDDVAELVNLGVGSALAPLPLQWLNLSMVATGHSAVFVFSFAFQLMESEALNRAEPPLSVQKKTVTFRKSSNLRHLFLCEISQNARENNFV